MLFPDGNTWNPWLLLLPGAFEARIALLCSPQADLLPSAAAGIGMTIEWDREMIATLHSLRGRGWSRAEVAARIGVTRETLTRYCRTHGIDPREFRRPVARPTMTPEFRAFCGKFGRPAPLYRAWPP